MGFLIYYKPDNYNLDKVTYSYVFYPHYILNLSLIVLSPHLESKMAMGLKLS